MPGTTPKGYPYAQPADPLVQWPATSQALAEKIETQGAADIAAALTGIPKLIDAGTYTGTNTVTAPTLVSIPFNNLFTAPPVVVACATNAQNAIVTVHTVHVDKVDVTFQPAPGQTQALVRVAWVAIGPK